MNTYPVGNISQLLGAFTNAAGTAADPTAVEVQIKPPQGPVITATPTRIGVGQYAYNLLLTMGGIYKYRFVGSGAVTAQTPDEPLMANPTSF